MCGLGPRATITAMTDRDLDVVVLGATGVTGRRVAAYLDERSRGEGFAWGAAVRDAAKLEGILREVGVAEPITLIADTSDPESLAAMAGRAKVVLNLVGPYALHAEPVIAACIASGTSYVDLSGEIPFVRRMNDRYGDAARAAGVAVVQVCGFEALPPDLAVRLAAEAARERFGEDLAAVDLEVRFEPPPGLPRPSDSVSGGTSQSMAAVAADPDAALAADPAALIDGARAARVRDVSPIEVSPRRGRDATVIAPMTPAAFINPAVIQRSAALSDDDPPPPFRYREGIALDGSPATVPLRFAAAGAIAATQIGFRRAVLAGPATRRRVGAALGRILPSSGFGPDPDRLEDWKWSMRVDALTTGGHALTVKVEATGHPGYLTTARMIAEAGLILSARTPSPGTSGCLTPAVALGTESIPRLERAGLAIGMA